MSTNAAPKLPRDDPPRKCATAWNPQERVQRCAPLFSLPTSLDDISGAKVKQKRSPDQPSSSVLGQCPPPPPPVWYRVSCHVCCCWTGVQHNAQHMQFTRRKEKLVKSRARPEAPFAKGL